MTADRVADALERIAAALEVASSVHEVENYPDGSVKRARIGGLGVSDPGPTKQQIERFLKCFDALLTFEAQQILIRGQGALSVTEWPLRPDPDVVAVKYWLEKKARE